MSTTGDSTVESDGSVTVTLLDEAVYDLGAYSSATARVADDDGP